MKTTRKALLIIGYLVCFSFLAYALYLAITVINDTEVEEAVKLLPLIVLIASGGAIFGGTLIDSLVTMILAVKLKKQGESPKLYPDIILGIASVASELILLMFLIAL